MNRQNRFRIRNNYNENINNELGPIQSELSFNTLVDGATGSTGVQGSQGSQGPQGTGPQGSQGRQGFIGLGNQGWTGRQGGTGPQGTPGSQGAQGPAGGGTGGGFTGSQGSQGSQGPAGGGTGSGTQGSVGNTGTQGGQGSQGRQGFTGPQGTQGSQGRQGFTGPQGTQGSQGRQGNTGPSGFQGLQGPAGGGTGNVSGSTGSQGSTGTQGFQGQTGPQGRQGVQGIVGPQGRQGITGLQGTQGVVGNTGAGNQGPSGLQGLQGSTGATGTQGPQGICCGTTGATGPQGPSGGPQGNQGSKGSTGAGGSLTISTLPTNIPLVTNNTVFETSGATLSKTSFRDIFRTISGLTNSLFYTNQDQILINKYQFLSGGYEPYRIDVGNLRDNFYFTDTYQTQHLGHSYDGTQYQAEVVFNAYIGSGPYWYSTMSTTDPRYNIARYFSHAKSDQTGVTIKARVKFANGGTHSNINLRDELKMYIEKDNMTQELSIIGTNSSYNTSGSIHNLEILLNQQTDFTLIATVNRTVTSGSNTYILDTQYLSYSLLDYSPEYGGKIKLYIPNGATNSSRIQSWSAEGHAWMAPSNTF